MLLTKRGVDCHLASNGQEAVNAFRETIAARADQGAGLGWATLFYHTTQNTKYIIASHPINIINSNYTHSHIITSSHRHIVSILIIQTNTNTPSYIPSHPLLHLLTPLLHLLTHSLTHSYTPSLTLSHPLLHPLTPLLHPLIHLLTPLLHSLTHSYTPSLTHSYTLSLAPPSPPLSPLSYRSARLDCV